MLLTYLERTPSSLLAPFVRCYWALRAAERLGPWRVLPDGCADWMFDLGRGQAQWVGTMTRAIETPVRAGTRLFGVRFHPGALHAFTGRSLQPFTDAVEDLRGLPGVELAALTDALEAAPDFGAACAAADSALAAGLSRARPSPLGRLFSWLEHCEELPRVRALAERSGWSTRSLERQFQLALGVRPKQHLRFLRFDRARRSLEAAGFRGAEIAAEVGYVDEAHLVHEFKRFAGVTPAAYRVAFLQSRGVPPG